MDYIEEFIKKITQVNYQDNSRYFLFSDFVEIAALTVHQSPYHRELIEIDDEYEKIEQLYMSAIKKYNKEQLSIFAQLIAITQAALIDRYCDFLGEAYEKLEISNSHAGQFFSPYTLSKLLANIQCSDLSKILESKGYVTLNEPACGAGGMIIAVAERASELNYDPSKVLLFLATDISRICFNMTYIQTSMLGLAGTVVQGDTITVKENDRRDTPLYKILKKTPRTPSREIPLVTAPPKNRAGQMELFY